MFETKKNVEYLTVCLIEDYLDGRGFLNPMDIYWWYGAEFRFCEIVLALANLDI